MSAPSTQSVQRVLGTALHSPLVGRVADYAVIALAVILGYGSIALFVWPNRPVFLPLGLSPEAAIWWNALVSFVFFVQHSVMVRRPVRARLAAIIPRRYDGAFYAITSGVALSAVAVLLQPGGKPLFVLEGFPRRAVISAALLAVAGFAWAFYALRTFDLLGLRPIREHLRDPRSQSASGESGASALVVRGPYRWVRHPLYSCVIVLLWADPVVRLDRLIFAAVWTAWIYVGARFEERDLIAQFGDAYRKYRLQVPILVPWRGRAELIEATASSLGSRT